MKRLSLLAAGLFLLQPLSAAAFYDTPAELLEALSADASPREAKAEAHAHAKMYGMEFFVSAWSNGRTQGELSDIETEMAMTFDVVIPSENVNVRAKGRFRIVDRTVYFILDSLDGKVGEEMVPAEVRESIGKWMSMPRPASVDDIGSMDVSELFKIFDENVVRIERTQGKDGSSYSVTLDRSVIRGIMDLLTMVDPEMGNVPPEFNFHGVVNTDVWNAIMNARSYLSLKTKIFSLVFQSSSKKLDSTFTVRAPANATPIEVPDYSEFDFDSPSFVPRSTSSNARYEARAAARALREKTVKKPVSSSKLPADVLSFGEESAPVTITEYTDYECPFCRRFHMDTYQQIKKDYIDTGKVRFVIKQYPLSQIHAGAWPAAMAVQCALDQGNALGRRAHEAMWVLQEAGNELNAQNIRKYVGMFADLDYAEFSECFDYHAKEDVINAQIAEGDAAGVMGTPAFFLNNRSGATGTISGAAPYSTFQDEIDALLK